MEIAIYEISRYIAPDELKLSDLYGDSDSYFLFDIAEFTDTREGDYRVSLGQPHWAVVWFHSNGLLGLEISYLDQDGVLDVLTTLAKFFDITMCLLDNAGNDSLPKTIRAADGTEN